MSLVTCSWHWVFIAASFSWNTSGCLRSGCGTRCWKSPYQAPDWNWWDCWTSGTPSHADNSILNVLSLLGSWAHSATLFQHSIMQGIRGNPSPLPFSLEHHDSCKSFAVLSNLSVLHSKGFCLFDTLSIFGLLKNACLHCLSENFAKKNS